MVLLMLLKALLLQQNVMLLQGLLLQRHIVVALSKNSFVVPDFVAVT